MILTLVKEPKTSCKLVRLKTVVNLKSIRESGNASLGNYIGLENIEPWTGRLLPSLITSDQLDREDPEIKSMVSNFESGDILFGKLRPYLAKAYLAEESGVCTTELLVLEPSSRLDGKFLKNVILTSEFINAVNAETYGVKMPRADWNTISNLLIPLPPLSQQRQIADYLDCETAKLDALITAKQRLLTLLAEKRRAMITQAVTRGIRADVPMKKLGLGWIKEVPEHWKVEHLKYHLSGIEQGWSPLSDNSPADLDEWGVLKVGAVNGWEFDPTENKRIPPELEPNTYYEIKPGDVLVSRANTPELVGSAALVKTVRPNLMLCDKLYRLTMHGDRLDPEYLVFYLRSLSGRFTFERDASGASSSMQNISQETLSNLWIPTPPLVEQTAILTYLKKKILALTSLESTTENAISLLKERRTSLISAAVTGQVQIAA